MSEPNFFIAGIPKCGTTALFDYLWQHPNIWCSPVKEPNYFATDYPALRGPQNDAEYNRLFAGAGPEHLARGEASVLYFYSRTALPLVRERYPAARLIIMIRNPVDMVYSYHSQMLTTLNECEPDFERAWRLQGERRQGRSLPARCLAPDFLQYGDMGLFSKRIERIHELFPAEQLKILLFDDMREDPRAVFDDVTDFLGLQRYGDVDFRVVNANKVQKSRLVAGLTERPPSPALQKFVSGLRRTLGLQRVGLRRWLAGLNTTERPRVPMTPAFRRELQQYFAAEITALERITGRDLAAWRR